MQMPGRYKYHCFCLFLFLTLFHSRTCSLGIWIGWIVGTVIGINALLLAKCMEVFVHVIMAPVRVVQGIHIKTIKLIVKMLENTPGGVNVLKVFNGYVSTDAATVAHD